MSDCQPGCCLGGNLPSSIFSNALDQSNWTWSKPNRKKQKKETIRRKKMKDRHSDARTGIPLYWLIEVEETLIYDIFGHHNIAFTFFESHWVLGSWRNYKIRFERHSITMKRYCTWLCTQLALRLSKRYHYPASWLWVKYCHPRDFRCELEVRDHLPGSFFFSPFPCLQYFGWNIFSFDCVSIEIFDDFWTWWPL